MPRSRVALARLLPAVFIALLGLSRVMVAAPPVPSFAKGVAVGTNTSSMIWEVSGLVASRQNPGVLWTHNDSGYRGSVFALSTNGALLGRYDLSNVFSGDFEDIALGPGPRPEVQYVYLADIGDNALVRKTIRVFRFPEPAVYSFQSNAPTHAAVSSTEEITLVYPDGPFNAESLMLDPVSGDLCIATKQTNQCRVYRATQAELDGGGTVTLTFVASPAFRSASAADISPDGALIAIRRPGRAGLWVRQAGQSVADALKVDPATLPVIGQPTEPNGESFAFAWDVSGYYTVSEGLAQPVYWFARTDPPPAKQRVLVPAGADWEVSDFGEPLPPGWTTNLESFSMVAPGPLGSGGSERTTLERGVPTTFFLHRFTNGSLSLTSMVLKISFADGAAVYLNGKEIFRRHLPGSAVFDDFALGSNAGEFRDWFAVPVDPRLLEPGLNVISAEVHRFEPEQPFLHFDLQLVEGSVANAAAVTSTAVTENEFVATVGGPAGLNVAMESSEDFMTWTAAGAVVLTNGLGTFSSPMNKALEFYRVRPGWPRP